MSRIDGDQPLTDYIAEHPRRVIVGSLAIIAFTFAMPFAVVAFHDEERYGPLSGCESDEQCLNVCERDNGRECTDTDLFGPGEEDDEDLRPDSKPLAIAVGCR